MLPHAKVDDATRRLILQEHLFAAEIGGPTTSHRGYLAVKIAKQDGACESRTES